MTDVARPDEQHEELAAAVRLLARGPGMERGIGTLFTQEEVLEQFGAPADQVVTAVSGFLRRAVMSDVEDKRTRRFIALIYALGIDWVFSPSPPPDMLDQRRAIAVEKLNVSYRTLVRYEERAAFDVARVLYVWRAAWRTRSRGASPEVEAISALIDNLDTAESAELAYFNEAMAAYIVTAIERTIIWSDAD